MRTIKNHEKPWKNMKKVRTVFREKVNCKYFSYSCFDSHLLVHLVLPPRICIATVVHYARRVGQPRQQKNRPHHKQRLKVQTVLLRPPRERNDKRASGKVGVWGGGGGAISRRRTGRTYNKEEKEEKRGGGGTLREGP